MTAAGIHTDGPPRDNHDYEIYHFFATDPDGHQVEVQRFWNGEWDQGPPGL